MTTVTVLIDILTTLIIGAALYLILKFLFGGGSSHTATPTTTAARRQRVSVEDINQVSALFPHIPRPLIEQDLERTGSVPLTCERILSGHVVGPTDSPQTSSSSQPTPVGSSPARGPLDPRSVKLDTPIPEPDSSFAQSASDRESQLRKRKDYMIQQARLKYLDKEASRKKEVSSL